MLNENISEDEYLRIKKLKSDFDNYLITEDQISEKDKEIIRNMYKVQIKKMDYEIAELKNAIEEFKSRMKEAMDYLESRNNENISN